jgi:hypothetical protein
MWRPYLFLALLSATARTAHAAGDSAGTLPPWLAYVTGGLLVVIIVYYCCRRARFDENLQQPLLGGCVLMSFTTCLGLAWLLCDVFACSNHARLAFVV